VVLPSRLRTSPSSATQASNNRVSYKDLYRAVSLSAVRRPFVWEKVLGGVWFFTESLGYSVNALSKDLSTLLKVLLKVGVFSPKA